MTQTSEPTPALGVRADDLANACRDLGPVVTAYLPTERDVENAAQRSEARWKTIRRDLGDAGAPEEALGALDPLVADAHLRGATLVAVAGPDRLRHAEHPGHALPEGAWWAALPRLLPAIEYRQSIPPHLVALADRRGADIWLNRYLASDLRREAGDVREDVERVAPGGWSQRRYQESAQNAWKENSEDAARQIVELVGVGAPRLLLAAGDQRAVQLLREALPDEVAGLVEVLDGGRGADGSWDSVWQEVRRRVAVRSAQETEQVVAAFREEAGQRDRAAEGPAATLAALGRSQVEVLLVHDDRDDERTAWVGPGPDHIATRRETLASLGIDPVEARLVDAAVRAALGTGAAVRVVPREIGLDGGMGAILRWSD